MQHSIFQHESVLTSINSISPHPKRLWLDAPKKCVLTLAILMACSEPSRGPIISKGPSQNPFIRPDTAVEDDTSQPTHDPTPVVYCTPGERHCLFENSPLFMQCDNEGRSTKTRACPERQVCRNKVCEPFTCVPGRNICVGTTSTAVCDPSGRGILNPESCSAQDICLGGQCTNLCARAQREQSYTGCNYIAYELENAYRAEQGTIKQSPFGIVVANGSSFLDAHLTATMADGQQARLIPEFSLIPDPSYTYGKKKDLISTILNPDTTQTRLTSARAQVTIPPRSAAVLLIDDERSGQGPFFIKTSQPVVAYQFSPYCCNFTATNDASLLIPIESLRTRYRILSYPVMDFGHAKLSPYFTVIATENNTRIQVTSPAPLLLNEQTQATPYSISTTLERAKVATFRLDHTKALSTKKMDLSGAQVISNAPVSVFAGHPCTFVPQDFWACDHLQEQMLPADTLGHTYLLQPVRRRNANDKTSQEFVYWRIVADADAKIEITPAWGSFEAMPPSTPSTPDCKDALRGMFMELKEGQVCEFGTREAISVLSDAPLLVGGIISGHESTGVLRYGVQAGDPAFFLAPPVEQFRRNYNFVTPPTFQRTYASIAIEMGTQVAKNNRFISNAQKLERKEVNLGDTRWEIFSIALESGVHTLQCDRPFGLVVYAYDDYVSYAFPGGLDLISKGKQ